MAGVSPFLESQSSRIGRWASAAVIVCGLHAGAVALALMQWPQEEAADDLAGALTVEMAPLPAPAPVDTPDVALGPEQQEARLTPEAAKEEVVEKVEEELPPVEPSPAPEPEVALPEPQPKEKEEEPEEEVEEPQEEIAEEEVPQLDNFEQEEKAPAPVEAPPKPPSSVEKPGRSAKEVAREQRTWQRQLSRHLERFKRYPRRARRRGLEGAVVVRFVLDRSGRVVVSEIVEGSGSSSLDNAVLTMLRRASPLPAPPDLVPDALLDNSVRIEFNIR